MPTVKDLQKAIKEFKSTRCPSFSKLKKAQLERFAKDNNIKVNDTSKKKPKAHKKGKGHTLQIHKPYTNMEALD